MKQRIISNYGKLRTYADRFFKAVAVKYPENFQCKKGCGGCCILKTVMPIEALMIIRYLQKHPVMTGTKTVRSGRKCVFLMNGICQIYPVRPLICRTHGLPVRESVKGKILLTCSRNFNPRSAVPENSILDSGMLSENLARLNLAFCMISDVPKEAGKRYSLKNLLKGHNPAYF